ncbi:hypothetical protein FDP41_002838 [Naegleria fowleri]|uniref:Uncharacterized protein n=1 Tax=Naegleria fowleri TaxID=5763 RepID=A0A6A5BK21_NAEFO|nr:uncharacterized protein FDP41_002838 [Naegleria fowleri]KAF0978323.1 hypothetical protein FDP41_002838 [Naegleria fowleri]CAG4718433.1 unnamed protein product [Naegleria fowleri]
MLNAVTSFNHRRRSTSSWIVSSSILLFLIFNLFFVTNLVTTLLTNAHHHERSPLVLFVSAEETQTTSFPNLLTPSIALTENSIIDKLLKEMRKLLREFKQDVASIMKDEIVQAILQVMHDRREIDQLTGLIVSSLTLEACSNNLTKLINTLPFGEILYNGLYESKYPPKIVKKVVTDLTDQEVVNQVKNAFQTNFDIQGIVSDFINATLTQLSQESERDQITQLAKAYLLETFLNGWVMALVISLAFSIMIIPSLLMFIILQNIIPFRKILCCKKKSKSSISSIQSEDDSSIVENYPARSTSRKRAMTVVGTDNSSSPIQHEEKQHLLTVNTVQ